MKFHTISNEYIDFLKSIDSKVPNHSGPNYQRAKPFLGVVFSLNDVLFSAPLTSYKPRQDDILTSAITAFKIYNRQDLSEKLGLVSLNYMIPILDSEISYIDFQQQEYRYKNLLTKQYQYISRNKSTILDKAHRLYNHVATNTNPKDFITSISCDFVKLLREHKRFNS